MPGEPGGESAEKLAAVIGRQGGNVPPEPGPVPSKSRLTNPSNGRAFRRSKDRIQPAGPRPVSGIRTLHLLLTRARRERMKCLVVKVRHRGGGRQPATPSLFCRSRRTLPPGAGSGVYSASRRIRMKVPRGKRRDGERRRHARGPGCQFYGAAFLTSRSTARPRRLPLRPPLPRPTAGRSEWSRTHGVQAAGKSQGSRYAGRTRASAAGLSTNVPAASSQTTLVLVRREILPRCA